MARIPFEELPPTSRIWVFSADRPLTREERARLDAEVEAFLTGWNAHGTPLRGAGEWRHGRFLVVGVDQEAAPPSGCSIDALVRVFKDMEKELDVRLLDRSPVWYRAGEEIRCVTREEFGRLGEEGAVGPETVVFDGSVTRMSDLREGRWEVAAGESWHRRLL